MNFKLLVVSFLAIFLIGLYIFAMVDAIQAASGCVDKVCTGSKYNQEGLGYIFSGVGAIVAAFAVGFLAVAEPNAVPTSGVTLTTNPKDVITLKIEKAIPLLFVLTWLICGAVAVYFGLIAEKSVQALTEMAKAWLGTVLTAVGAYWGIRK